MVYAKKVKIIEFIILAIIMGYLFTSLMYFAIQVDINITSSEAKYWAFNILTAIIMSIIFMIIHGIIKNYSFRQIVNSFRLAKLRTIKPFKIVSTLGLILLLLPLIIFLYSLFLIPSIIKGFFGIVLIFFFTGFILLIIGLIITPKNKDKGGKQISLAILPSDVHSQRQSFTKIKNAYLGFFIINWIVIMPLFALIFYFIFKMNFILVIIIMLIWANISFVLLLYLNAKKKQDNVLLYIKMRKKHYFG